jgi:hypothetical protein
MMELKKNQILGAILKKISQSYTPDKYKVTMNQNVLVVSLNEMENGNQNTEYQILVKGENESLPTSYQVTIRTSIGPNGQVNFETSCLKDGDQNQETKAESAMGKEDNTLEPVCCKKQQKKFLTTSYLFVE